MDLTLINEACTTSTAVSAHIRVVYINLKGGGGDRLRTLVDLKSRSTVFPSGLVITLCNRCCLIVFLCVLISSMLN